MSKVGRQLLPLHERFWQRVEKTDACWLWRGGLSGVGRGIFHEARHRRVFAHRFSWWLHYGEIPEGFNVCHRCDNPRCVRPDHLFLGTQADNIADMKRKGRVRNGPIAKTSGYVERVDPHSNTERPWRVQVKPPCGMCGAPVKRVEGQFCSRACFLKKIGRTPEKRRADNQRFSRDYRQRLRNRERMAPTVMSEES